MLSVECCLVCFGWVVRTWACGRPFSFFLRFLLWLWLYIIVVPAAFCLLFVLQIWLYECRMT